MVIKWIVLVLGSDWLRRVRSCCKVLYKQTPLCLCFCVCVLLGNHFVCNHSSEELHCLEEECFYWYHYILFALFYYVTSCYAYGLTVYKSNTSRGTVVYNEFICYKFTVNQGFMGLIALFYIHLLLLEAGVQWYTNFTSIVTVTTSCNQVCRTSPHKWSHRVSITPRWLVPV